MASIYRLNLWTALESRLTDSETAVERTSKKNPLNFRQSSPLPGPASLLLYFTVLMVKARASSRRFTAQPTLYPSYNEVCPNTSLRSRSSSNSMAPSISPPILHATFSSPTDQHNFSHPLRAPLPEDYSPLDPTSVEAKTAYLSELRSSTKNLQDEINAFLTQKMEEEKATAAAPGSTQKGAATEKSEIEAQLQEDRYGEEEEDEDG